MSTTFEIYPSSSPLPLFDVPSSPTTPPPEALTSFYLTALRVANDTKPTKQIENKQEKENGTRFMPLEQYRQLLRQANWEAFNTSLYLNALKRGVPLETVTENLALDWLGYFGEHVLRLADQVYPYYNERGINGASSTTLLDHAKNTIDHLKQLQKQQVQAADGKIFSPDRAILEAAIVAKIIELQSTNKWIIYISPRGEKHHLYPGTALEDYVVIYVIKGNEFHQLMTWHNNRQLNQLMTKLLPQLDARRISIDPGEDIQWSKEMMLEQVFVVDKDVKYQAILEKIHQGKESWVLNPDEHLTTIKPAVVTLQAEKTAAILRSLFLELVNGDETIKQAAGNLTQRQQLNLLTEILQEKFASLAFQTQMELNQFSNDKNTFAYKQFYNQKMQHLIQATDEISLALIRSVWLIRLKQESGQSEQLDPAEQKQIHLWEKSIKIPAVFGRTASLLHCSIGTLANPSMISSVAKLQHIGFNPMQINFIREWQAKGYKLARFEHDGQVIAYMVPDEYDLHKMYFDADIGDVIGPCGVPLSQDHFAHLVIGAETLSTDDWFNRQTKLLVTAVSGEKKEKVTALLHRIEVVIFVDTMGLDQAIAGDSIRPMPQARSIYRCLQRILGDKLQPHKTDNLIEELLGDDKLLTLLQELEVKLGLIQT